MTRIDDGFKTLISFAANPNVTFEEKEVTPPSMEGGGAIDTTTMRNTSLRTKSPKQLKSLGDMKLTVAYGSAALMEIWALINQNTQITITLPTGNTFTFWGWLDTANPGALSEGNQPTLDITIIPSNRDNNGIEQEPVYT